MSEPMQQRHAAVAAALSPVGDRSAAARGYRFKVGLLGVYNGLLAIVLVTLLFSLWPEGTKDPSTQAVTWSKDVVLLGRHYVIGNDARLILLVLFTGALGSYVHAATSFVSYVGNRRLVFSWAWWYLLRPFMGMALALIFYFVIRGGLLATSAGPDQVSPFGIAAVAGLVGMFSKQATDKLREMFDNLFRTETGQGDDARADKLGANRPVAGEMIERSKIVAYTIPKDAPDDQVSVVDLHQMLGGVVTRIPVLDHAGVAKCVIHQSLLYKFLADKGIEAAKAGASLDVRSFSLKDFLDAPGMRELVQDSMGFAPVGATLAEAKQAMDQLKNCQDVFVTERGSRDEPVLGWLTDGELRRHSKV